MVIKRDEFMNILNSLIDQLEVEEKNAKTDSDWLPILGKKDGLKYMIKNIDEISFDENIEKTREEIDTIFKKEYKVTRDSISSNSSCLSENDLYYYDGYFDVSNIINNKIDDMIK